LMAAMQWNVIKWTLPESGTFTISIMNQVINMSSFIDDDVWSSISDRRRRAPSILPLCF